MSSFVPLNSTGLSSSLFGVGDPVKFTDNVNERLEERGIHGRASQDKHQSDTAMILLIVISAVIFVTAVSIYDIIKVIIINIYAEQSLRDQNGKNEDIERTLISNRANLASTIAFGIVCIAIALIALPILIRIYDNAR